MEFESRRYKTFIWDTAGQERFHSLTRSYFRESHGILLVYDTTKEESVRNLHSWYTQVAAYSPEATTLLIGNKVDLPQDKYSNIDQLAQEFADEYGLQHMKTSAKEAININESIYLLLKSIVRNASEHSLGAGSEDRPAIIPTQETLARMGIVFGDRKIQPPQLPTSPNTLSYCCT